MYRYKLLIAYEGTQYCGWQIQPNGPTIQENLQNCIKIILHLPDVVVIGSGRTDAGVHAIGQVAHFNVEQPIEKLNRFLYALNGTLPKDIRVKKIEEVDADFHAQYSAKGKEYHYHLYLDRVMDPFRRRYCWHVYTKMDLELLKQGASLFTGEHDFSAFANEAHSGSAGRDPVRNLYRLDVIKEEGGVRLEFEGDGFLYKMVRNIVGTLVDVASTKRPIEDITKIFESKDRRKASLAAPPHGLFLVNVLY